MDASSGLLWQCPPVITNIFKHLCAKDLGSCAQVCTLWNNMSIKENNRRRSVGWFLELSMNQTCTMEETPIPILSTLYPFQQQIADAWSKPSFCVAFVNTDTLEFVPDAPPSYPPNWKRPRSLHHSQIRTKLQSVRDNFLRPVLPAQCRLLCIAAPGLVGSYDNYHTTEWEGGRGIAGLLIPDIPGVCMSQCSFEDYHLWFAMNERFTTPGNRPIKGMLAFTSSPLKKLAPVFIGEYVRQNGAEFAVGGAVVEPDLVGLGTVLLFTGENVEVASVVIGENATEEDVAVELALFKKTGMLSNQCFAFMFSCADKGFMYYECPNFESDEFRKLYPEVPLVGVFGNGELGNHFLPNVDKEDPEHKKRCEKFPLDNCLQAHSSVFVMVSVKVPK